MNGPIDVLLGKILQSCQQTPFSYILKVLSNVFPGFPGSQVLDIIPFGASSWSHTAHVEVRQRDGCKKDYFVKVRISVLYHAPCPPAALQD